MVFCLKVLHVLPGTIFEAEKANEGSKEITRAKTNPLEKVPLIRISRV
jgi:hypothetical protein